MDIEIDAGEEAGSTDGIVELENTEYAESESSVTLAEDFMDIDVSVTDTEDEREDSIEAILPKSPMKMVT